MWPVQLLRHRHRRPHVLHGRSKVRLGPCPSRNSALRVGPFQVHQPARGVMQRYACFNIAGLDLTLCMAGMPLG